MARRGGDGLYLRGDHKNIWWWESVIHGKRYQLPLGKGISRSLARELAAIKRAKIIKGEEGIGIRKKDCKFIKAKEEFLKWTEANKRRRTLRTHRQCLEHLSLSFDGKHLSQISSWLIEKHKQARAQAGARVRANRETSVLKSLFNFSIRMGLFHGSNPVVGVKFFKEEKRKFRYLEPEEEHRLVQELKEPIRTLVLVGIHCGLRVQSEGLTLEWDYIDLRRNQLSVEASYAKNGERRDIPLNSTVSQALANLEKSRMSDFVFTKPGGDTPYRSIRRSFERACKRAGLQGVTPHTLRHTFASRLVMAGVDLRTVQELGGWKDIGMVTRYAHLSSRHKAEAVARIATENSPTISPTFVEESLGRCV